MLKCKIQYYLDRKTEKWDEQESTKFPLVAKLNRFRESGPSLAWLTHAAHTPRQPKRSLTRSTYEYLTHTQDREMEGHMEARSGRLPISLSFKQRDGCTAFGCPLRGR